MLARMDVGQNGCWPEWMLARMDVGQMAKKWKEKG
jgi:hypothetical protein